MMMEKDALLLDDSQLEAIAGGGVNVGEFLSKANSYEAQKYLMSSGVLYSTAEFNRLMTLWTNANGNTENAAASCSG